MFDHWLRALKDVWLTPFARMLGRNVAPNAITILACLVGLLSAGAVARAANGLAVALWLGNRVLDGLDGTMARVHGRQTAFGGYLDIVLDFTVYAAIPVAMLAAVPTQALGMATAVLLSSFLINAASWMYLSALLEQSAAGAKARGELTSVTMPPGIIAGAETFALYTVFLVLPAWRTAGFYVMAALVGVNIIQRLVWGAQHLEQADQR